MFNNKRVGCVILNYKSANEVFELVSLIEKYNCIDNIVVVDNDSHDQVETLLKKVCSNKLKLIFNHKNNGYACGNNIGFRYLIEKCNADYICLTNPDVTFTEESVLKLLEEAEHHKDLGLISGVICSSGDHVPPFAWKLPGYLDCLEEEFLLINRLREKRRLYRKDSEIINVDVIPGAFFIASAKALKDVGYFDERTFLYYEENILSWKLKEKGYRNYILTAVKVNHRVSTSINKTFSKFTQQAKILQNSKVVYYKHYLKVNKTQLVIATCSFELGLLEKKIYKSFKRMHR